MNHYQPAFPLVARLDGSPLLQYPAEALYDMPPARRQPKHRGPASWAISLDHRTAELVMESVLTRGRHARRLSWGQRLWQGCSPVTIVFLAAISTLVALFILHTSPVPSGPPHEFDYVRPPADLSMEELLRYHADLVVHPERTPDAAGLVPIVVRPSVPVRRLPAWEAPLWAVNARYLTRPTGRPLGTRRVTLGMLQRRGLA